MKEEKNFAEPPEVKRWRETAQAHAGISTELQTENERLRDQVDELSEALERIAKLKSLITVRQVACAALAGTERKSPIIKR